MAIPEVVASQCFSSTRSFFSLAWRSYFAPPSKIPGALSRKGGGEKTHNFYTPVHFLNLPTVCGEGVFFIKKKLHFQIPLSPRLISVKKIILPSTKLIWGQVAPTNAAHS